jgi:hypothetical protein
VADTVTYAVNRAGQLREMAQDAAADHQHVSEQEEKEHRKQGKHRLAHAPDVQGGEHEDEPEFDRELGVGPAWRQKAEERVSGGRDRDRDRQDVVHQEGGARHDSGTRSEQLARDHVAATPARELLDDPPVAGRDQQHRDRHEEREPHGEVGVPPERLEGLLRAIGGGRQPVRPQANPGQERDQGQPMKEAVVFEVAGLAEEEAPATAQEGILVRPHSRFAVSGQAFPRGRRVGFRRSRW